MSYSSLLIGISCVAVYNHDETNFVRMTIDFNEAALTIYVILPKIGEIP
jgi:hypothetical protein